MQCCLMDSLRIETIFRSSPVIIHCTVLLLHFVSYVTSLLPYICSVHDTTLSCIDMKDVCCLERQELVKVAHVHPQRVTTCPSTETVMLFTAPRVHESTDVVSDH